MAQSYHLSLSQFDGPLDLLLTLIGKAKIDIKDIFVSEVTEQYIRSIESTNDLDMDDASEFIEMAATLLYIKTKSLLPSDEEEEEDEEDIKQELIRRLEEYQAVKKMAEEMQSFEKAAAALFCKLPEEYPLPPPNYELTGMTLTKLSRAINDLLARIKDKEDLSPKVRRIMRESYTVSSCIKHILRRVKKGSLSFFELLSDDPTKEEVVTHFLALLELLRLGKVHCVQEGIEEEILLRYAEEGESNDDA